MLISFSSLSIPFHHSSSLVRSSELKKVWHCDGKGYIALQQTLLDGKQTCCKSCSTLLVQCKFDQAAMEAEVIKAMQAEAPGHDPEEAPEKPSGASGQPDQDQDHDQPDAEPEDPMEWVKSLEPVIVQLPPGTHGRKFPFRCTICKTRRQPDGKLLEGVKGNGSSIRGFLQKHIDTPTHQGNLETYNAMPPGNEDVAEVPCEALLGGWTRKISSMYVHVCLSVSLSGSTFVKYSLLGSIRI